MDTQAKPRVAIIGAGRLGGNLCAWLSDAKYPISAICSRNVERMREIMWTSRCSAALFQNPVEAAFQADIVFLTLPDAMIRGCSLELSEAIRTVGGEWKTKLFVHCSGAQCAEILAPIEAAGASTAVFHPIQSFTPLPNQEKLGDSPFRSITIGIEGSDKSYGTLSSVALDLQAASLRLSPDSDARARYHAAAVLASNAMVALIDSAVGLLESDGQSEEAARMALIPLLAGTVKNLIKMPTGEALTGPVMRGDAATIERHLRALPQADKALYAETMRRAVKVALKGKHIDASQAAALLATLIL